MVESQDQIDEQKSDPSLGMNHLSTLQTVCALATLYYNMGRLDDARVKFEQVIIIMMRMMTSSCDTKEVSYNIKDVSYYISYFLLVARLDYPLN